MSLIWAAVGTGSLPLAAAWNGSLTLVLFFVALAGAETGPRTLSCGLPGDAPAAHVEALMLLRPFLSLNTHAALPPLTVLMCC